MARGPSPKKIIVTGAGPCLIGQGREFEYCGYQTLSVLKERGIQTVAVNDDPTSIFMNPDLAAQIYCEPLTMEFLEKIFATERPDGFLQVLGNQTTLNLTIFFDRDGIFDRYGMQVFGSSPESLVKTEDRELLRAALKSISIGVPEGRLVGTTEESFRVAKDLTYPVILKPVFALKGIGGFVSYNMDETKGLTSRALKMSPVGEVVVEKALLGWKELEFEVLRDASGKALALASFENLDPVGIHTGDSLSVYPFQTVPRKIVQDLRRISREIVAALGLIGSVTIQYGLRPGLKESAVIDVSPGLTGSTALLSSATGVRLAEIATKLALGDHIDNLFSKAEQSRLEALETKGDVLTLKVPWFQSDVLADSELSLNASMKSIGNSLSFGSSFKEAYMKGFSPFRKRGIPFTPAAELRDVMHRVGIAGPRRLLYIHEAFRHGVEIDEVHELAGIDRFYLKQIRELVTDESRIRKTLRQSLDRKDDRKISQGVLRAKEQGFSDSDIATLLRTPTEAVSKLRQRIGKTPVPKGLGTVREGKSSFSRVCITYHGEKTTTPSKGRGKTKVLIVGEGSADQTPNSKVDDSCAAALQAVREENCETILLDSCADALRSCDGLFDKAYVEHLDEETLSHILSIEKPDGVIIQFGGERPLSHSSFLEKAGFTVLGTPAASIRTLQDPDLFPRFLDKLGLPSLLTKLVSNPEEILVKSRTMGFPVIITGTTGAGTVHSRILYDERNVAQFLASGFIVSNRNPVILQRFLENAIRFEVNALSDGTDVFVGPIIEHIEGTAVNPIDSACVLPSLTVDFDIMEEIRNHTTRIAKELDILGFLNVHYFLKDEDLGVLEIHPRASYTVSFASRAIGTPLAKVAARLLLGRKLREFGLDHEVETESIAVKEAALPFDRFPGVDPVLGPQPKSTGQVMAINETLGSAFAKSQISIGLPLPVKGKIFVSVRNRDKRSIVFVASKLLDLGFSLIATEGTERVLNRHGLEVEGVYKIAEGRPDVVDLIKNDEIQLIINTPRGERPRKDLMEIRAQAVASKVPCITTISGASAAVFAIQALKRGTLQPKSLKDYHGVNPA